jgi:hypothetical protein
MDGQETTLNNLSIPNPIKKPPGFYSSGRFNFSVIFISYCPAEAPAFAMQGQEPQWDIIRHLINMTLRVKLLSPAFTMIKYSPDCTVNP